VRLSFVNEGGLPGPKCVARTVSPRNPTRSLHRNEELTETGRVRTNQAARLELHYERVRLTGTVTERLTARAAAVELVDGRTMLRIEAEDVHGEVQERSAAV